jgi:squalene-hopene/tetraprenyl-beta-curcumene cyclase
MATVATLLSRAVTEIRRRLNGNGRLDLLLRDRTPAPYRLPRIPRLDRDVDRAIGNAQLYLLSRQNAEHYWVGELIGDSTLESDYVMMMHLLGIVDADKQKKLLAYVLRQQNEDGGWPIFNGGPSDLNATIKAYFALGLAGYSEYDPRLRRARETILRLGGIEASNSYTKFYLAIFGQYEWEKLPAMIPEIMLFPTWCWFNIYEVSAWTRTIVVPMMIIYALRPRIEVEFSLRELNVPFRHPRPETASKAFWQRYFKTADRLLHWYNHLPFKPLRSWAMHVAKSWMLERCKPPGGLGAIYPPMLNAIIALKCLGYSLDSPEMSKALAEFRELEVHDGDEIRIQPCFSSVWDTSWAVHALARSGLKDHPAVQKGADWLMKRQVFTGGDWQVKNPGIEPAAWYFENDNQIYPDTDDTSAVLMGLHFAGRGSDPNFVKGLKWMLSMRNRDGGWGAFDKDNDKELLNCVPWSDHNALLDPSTPDITGRILECLGYIGFTKEDKIVERAIDYIRRNQELDGSWYGRWGVNYIYGTWQVLVGLNAVRQNMNRGWVRRAVDWLKSVQNEDGGWGESCRSYEDLSQKAIGPSTPSQTSWGLLGLLAGRCSPKDPAVQRAVRYLISGQRDDGGWDESEHTGTGFPRVFYLVYTMYRHYFPLLALHAYREALASGGLEKNS